MTKLFVCTTLFLVSCFGAFSQDLPSVHQWDTTNAAYSFNQILKLKKVDDSLLFAFNRNYPDQQFQYDSLVYNTQDKFLIVYYKYFLREEKNEQNFYHMDLLSQMAAFSFGKERFIHLFNQYPKVNRESAFGKRMLEYANRGGENEGDNIKKAIASTQLKTLDGKEISLEKILTKQPIYILAFGASWCSPCKYNDRILHQAAAGWDSSRVKIIHLSIDTDPEKWVAGEREAVYDRSAYLLKGGVHSALTVALSIKGVQRYIVINEKADVILDHFSAKVLIKQLEPLVKETFTMAMLDMLY